MPLSNLNRKEPDKLIVLICGTAAALGISTPELARRSGIGQSTLYRRFSNPEGLTREEIKKIAKALRIPAEEIRAVSV